MGMRSGEQAGRWLAILDSLSGSRAGMTVGDLAREFGCTERTIYRDLQSIQTKVGAPLVDEHGDGGEVRWKLMEGSRFRAAPIEFTPSELIALAAAGRLMAPLAETPYGAGLKTLQAKVRARVPPETARLIDEDLTLVARPGARPDFRRLGATIE